MKTFKNSITLIFTLFIIAFSLTACKQDGDSRVDPGNSSDPLSSAGFSITSGSSGPSGNLYPPGTPVIDEPFTGWNPSAGSLWEASSLGSNSSWNAAAGRLHINGNDQTMLGNIELAADNTAGTGIYEISSVTGTHTTGEWNIRLKFYVGADPSTYGFIEVNHLAGGDTVTRSTFPGTGWSNSENRLTLTPGMNIKLKVERYADGNMSVFGWNSDIGSWHTVVDSEMFDSRKTYMQLYLTPGTFSDTREVAIDRVTTWGTTGTAVSSAQSIASSGSSLSAGISTNLSYKVHLFYYQWYGTLTHDSAWRHWQQNVGTGGLPDSIGADLYPALGLYSCKDDNLLDQHMQMIASARIGVIVVSWWGQGSWEDQIVPQILAAAAPYGIKVAWHMEPYGGRTAASTVNDINYINNNYGAHPAFFRAADRGNQPVFYIWNSLAISDWSALTAVNQSNIILAQHTDQSKADYFGGMFNYSIPFASKSDAEIQSIWNSMNTFCNNNNMVWSPSIIPGYKDARATGNTGFCDRDNGNTYDKYWNMAVNCGASWISITSFNEWHEGTVIEPAEHNPPAGYGYLDYEGVYGKTGEESETAYLERTAELILGWDPALQ